MPVPAGTTQTYTRTGIREDLADKIYMISPSETPILSAINTAGSCAQVLTEWQTDALVAVDKSNAQIQGDDMVRQVRPATSRPVNSCQLMWKVIGTTGTMRATKAAGRSDEHLYQAMKAGKELKRDMEAILFGEQGRNAGAAATPVRARAIESWLATNVSRGATGANGTDTTAPTDGTQRAFAEALLTPVIQNMWVQGAEIPRCTLWLGPGPRTTFSTFAGRGTQRQDVSDKAVLAAAEIYISNFGDLKVRPSRHIRARTGLIIDPEMVQVSHLRNMEEGKLAKTGDSDATYMLCESTLIVKNEAAHGVIADLN